MGKVQLITPMGNSVPAYDMDRTICDIVRSRSRIADETFLSSLKQYAANPNKNLANLSIYAEQNGNFATSEKIFGGVVMSNAKAMSLKAKIRNIAKSKNIPAQVILQNYMFERFLNRLSVSEYKEKFVLKGGMLVAASGRTWTIVQLWIWILRSKICRLHRRLLKKR